MFKSPERYLMMNQRYFTVNERVNLDSRDSFSNSDEFNLSDNYEIGGQGYLKQLLEGVHYGRRITSKTSRGKIKTKMNIVDFLFVVYIQRVTVSKDLVK